MFVRLKAPENCAPITDSDGIDIPIEADGTVVVPHALGLVLRESHGFVLVSGCNADGSPIEGADPGASADGVAGDEGEPLTGVDGDHVPDDPALDKELIEGAEDNAEEAGLGAIQVAEEAGAEDRAAAEAAEKPVGADQAAAGTTAQPEGETAVTDNGGATGATETAEDPAP